MKLEVIGFLQTQWVNKQEINLFSEIKRQIRDNKKYKTQIFWNFYQDCTYEE